MKEFIGLTDGTDTAHIVIVSLDDLLMVAPHSWYEGQGKDGPWWHHGSRIYIRNGSDSTLVHDVRETPGQVQELMMKAVRRK